MTRRQPMLGLFIVGAALLFSCAQNRGDINRVQPNVMKKADLLDGQWYFRNTVTKTPATTGFTFTGETGNLEKLVWEIQEGHLVGYRAYPFIVGVDSNIEKTSKPSGTTTRVCDAEGKCFGGQPYYGAPLVAYPILRHFDIMREYSTATGEQGNVVMENFLDRPWNEREYIRVNWSANLLNQGDSMSWNTLQNPAGGTDFNAWIQANEPGTDPYDWPTFEYGEDGKLKYFDFTGRYMARPASYYFEGYGAYPACFLRAGHRYDCTAQEIQMRTSLAKVDPNVTNDYEPLVYGNDLMEKFGYFRTERLNYDRKFGNTESARILLANRHRIFKGAFEKGPDGKPDATKPIPMDKRELRPIVYYTSPKDRMGNNETFQTYLEAARVLEANWDRAFRRAAAAAMGKLPSEVPQMFYVCENPVPAGAPSACGKEGFEARFGDLRYSFLYTITDPVPNGLLGYGPSSADPETGEIISANSNTYSAAVETIAQRALDTMDLLVGETTIENVIKGEDVLNFMKDNIPYPAKAYRKQGALESELQGVVQTGGTSKGAFERPTQALTGTLQRMSAQGGLPAFKGDRIKAATDVLEQNPDLESTILDNPEVQADLIGLLPEPLREKAMEDSAFARNASRSVLTRFTEGRTFQQSRMEWASRKNMYLVEFMDRPMLSLALREHQRREAKIIQLVSAGMPEVDARRQANDEVRRRLRQAIWRATSEHELGHTVGLRHNFQGSFDAINYFDDYWALRQETLSIKQGTSQVLPRTPTDLLNVALGSELQLSAGMRELEYSSIMDYGGKMNADISGIGKYDEAAILFAYSGGREPGYVEVFDNVRDGTLNFPGSDGQTVALPGAAYDLVITNAQHIHPGVPNYTERVHYSTVPLRFGEGNTVTNVIADGLEKLRTRRLMKWADVKAENDRIAALLKNNPNPSSADLAGAPLEVPYMFCTDDHVGYVLSCNRFDRGPDYLEMAQTKIEDYWNSYYFSHFKRDRYNFTSDGAFGGAYTTFSDLNAIYKHWAFALANQPKPGQQTLSKFTYDATMQDTWTMAVIDGINANLAVLTVPPAGFYRYRNIAPSGFWDIVSEGVDFDEVSAEGIAVLQDYYSNANNFSPPATKFAVMKRGQARRMYSRYDFKSGFGFFERMLEAGHYNDQMGAMFAAIEPQAQFLGTDVDADFNRYNIPYYLMFPDEMTQTFSSLWSGAEETVRPTMYLTRNDGGQVSTRPALYFKTFVPGQKYIQGFEYPKTENQPCTGGQTVGCLSTSQFPAPADFQLTWTSRIYSLWLGMAMFNVNYDLDFAKANQVFKVGGGEAFQVAPGYTSYELADIASGSRYVAVQKTTATQDTAAVRLIKAANAYLQVVENPTQCPPPSITGADGSELAIADCMPADERGNPALVEARRREFREYFQDQVRDLDLMRGFYAAFGRAF